jgi:ribosome-binding factor A
MNSTRQLKFSRLLQKELAEIFQRDQKSLFSGNIISVTNVEVSPDLSIAHVQLGMLLQQDKERMLQVVTAHKGEIKRSLGLKIGKQVRKIPDIVFHLDLGAEHAEKMNQLLKDLHIPPSTTSQ